jgi:hypothetical protein
MVVEVGAFSGSLRGSRLVLTKWRYLIPSVSAPKEHNADRWALGQIK